MEIDFDIYENLPNNEPILQDEVEKLQEQIRLMEAHIEALEADIAKLCAKVSEMKKVRENLEKNISELYKTAKAEIDRKDRMISELRTQLDQFILQRKYNHCFGVKRQRESSSGSHESEMYAKKSKRECDSRKSKRSPSPHKISRSRSKSRERHRRPHREKSRDRKRDYKSDGSDKYDHIKKLHSHRDNSAKTKSSVPESITNRRDTSEHKTVNNDVVGRDTNEKKIKEDNKICEKITSNLKDHVSTETPVTKGNDKMEMNVLDPNPKDLQRESVKELQMTKEKENICEKSEVSFSVSTLKDFDRESIRDVEKTQGDNQTNEIMEMNVAIPNVQDPETEKVESKTFPNLKENPDSHFPNLSLFGTPKEVESLKKNRTIEADSDSEVISKKKFNKADKTKTIKNVFENKPKAKARIADVTTKLIKRLGENKTASAVSCMSFETALDANEVTINTALRDLVRDAICNVDIKNVDEAKKSEETCVNVPSGKEKKSEATTSSNFPASMQVASTYDTDVEKSSNTEIVECIKQPSTEISSHCYDKNQIISSSIESVSVNPTDIVKTAAVNLKTTDDSAMKENSKCDNENMNQQTSKQIISPNKKNKSVNPIETTLNHTMNLESRDNTRKKEEIGKDEHVNVNKNKQKSKDVNSNNKKIDTIKPTHREKTDAVNLKSTDSSIKGESEIKKKQASKKTITLNKKSESINPTGITHNKNKQSSKKSFSVNKEREAHSKESVKGDSENLKTTVTLTKKEDSKQENENTTKKTTLKHTVVINKESEAHSKESVKDDSENLKMTVTSTKKEDSKEENENTTKKTTLETTKSDTVKLKDTNMKKEQHRKREDKNKNTSKNIVGVIKESGGSKPTINNDTVKLKDTDNLTKKENSKREDKNKQASKKIVSVLKKSGGSNPKEPIKGDSVNLKTPDTSTKKEGIKHESENADKQTSKQIVSLNKNMELINPTPTTVNHAVDLETRDNVTKVENSKNENDNKKIESLEKKNELVIATETTNRRIRLEVKDDTTKEENSENGNKDKQTSEEIISINEKTDGTDYKGTINNDVIRSKAAETSTRDQNSNHDNEHGSKQRSKQITAQSKKSDSLNPLDNAKTDTPNLGVTDKSTKQESENKTKQISQQANMLASKSELSNTTDSIKDDAINSTIVENTTEVLKENQHQIEDTKQTSKVDKKRDVKSVAEAKSKKTKDRRDSREKINANTKIKDRCEEEVPESDRVLRSAVRREKREKSIDSITEHQNENAVSSSGKMQENSPYKNPLNHMFLTNEFTSCVNLTHEGEIPVLHLPDSTNYGNLFDVNLNIENCPPVTSTPLVPNINMRLLQDDLNISFNESENKSTDNVETGKVSHSSDTLNGSTKSDNTLCNSVNLLNTSSARKRRRVVITWS